MNPPGSDELVYQFYVFHGTDHQSTASIYCHGFRFPGNPREDHYLGQGIYFFREDWQQARVWAEIKIMRVDELEGSSPCIIKAYIRVPERKFLNLDTRWGMRELAQHLQTIQGELRKKEKRSEALPKSCAVLSWIYSPGSGFMLYSELFRCHQNMIILMHFNRWGCHYMVCRYV
jgi:hypothetical protein